MNLQLIMQLYEQIPINKQYNNPQMLIKLNFIPLALNSNSKKRFILDCINMYLLV